MSDNLFRWIFFLINPFVSMIFTFLDYTSANAKNIFWAFCTFYGLTFAIGAESSSSDINRYVTELHQLYIQDQFSIADIIQYFQLSGEVDILRTFLSYIISRFTDSQAVLTTVYGFIFGFFFSRNIWYIFDLLKGKLSLFEKLLVFALILVVPIWFLGGFRMYTAFHIFMYGLLPYIFENKKKSILFVFLSFLVHFSFIVPISIVLAYLVFGNRIKFYFVIFVISIFISDFDVNAVNVFVEKYVPAAIDERSLGYRTEDKVALAKESIENDNRVWYVALYRKFLRWSLIISLIYFFLFANPLINFIVEWKKLFSLNLMFYSAANILVNVPSGGRFLNFPFFLTLVMVVLYLNQFKNDSKFRGLLSVLSPSFLLFILVSIRMGLYNTSISTVIGSPFIAFFMAGDTISLNDLIK